MVALGFQTFACSFLGRYGPAGFLGFTRVHGRGKKKAMNTIFTDIANVFTNFDATLFLSALGLAFVIEALPYVIFAERMPKILLSMAENPPRVLRSMGFFGICLGVFIIWLVRG